MWLLSAEYRSLDHKRCVQLILLLSKSKPVRKLDYFRFVCRQRGAGAAAFGHPRVWNRQRQGQAHSQAPRSESAPCAVLHIPELFTFYRAFLSI